jgi:methionyl-tRNA formyltransferase
VTTFERSVKGFSATLSVMTGLRIVLASYGGPQFEFLRRTLRELGHDVVAYTMSRSMRPSGGPEPDLLAGVQSVVETLPAGMDLLLPARPGALKNMLHGYDPDLFLIYGFNWRLPPAVFDLPRLGTINVHTSMLPRLRGPSPVPWAIRAGEKFLGVTIHRVNEALDSGPVLAQAREATIPDRVLPGDVWTATSPVIARLLAQALERLIRGDLGEPQEEAQASYAPFPPPEWQTISFDGTREDVHNQIRVLTFLSGGTGPLVEVEGRRVRVLATSTETESGIRVSCADGPLWITSHEAST